MSEFLKLCEQYFDNRDFYEILQIERTATNKDIKKAYHKLSLLIHPDRVNEEHKLEATEKFKILSKIHIILSDKDKRSNYDESGDFDEENDPSFNWLDYWRSMFKRITLDDIKNYEKEYKGSDTELRDIKRAYVAAKGNWDIITEMVPFSNFNEEPRIMEIVRKLISDGELEEYKIFFNEPIAKKEKRQKKFERESKECEEIDDSDLVKAIQESNEKREKKMSDFFADLEAKYGDKKQNKRKSLKNGSPVRKRSTRARK